MEAGGTQAQPRLTGRRGYIVPTWLHCARMATRLHGYIVSVHMACSTMPSSARMAKRQDCAFMAARSMQ